MRASLYGVGMSHVTIWAGCVAFCIPLVLVLIQLPLSKWKTFKRIKLFVMLVYIGILLYLTVFRGTSTERQVNLVPLWSYSRFSQADIRWQIYLNVFLFIPFGFMLPWAIGQSFSQAFMMGMLFSITIELTQYIFCLGFCEADDVIHNSLGTIIGYWYWYGLNKGTNRLSQKLKKRKE